MKQLSTAYLQEIWAALPFPDKAWMKSHFWRIKTLLSVMELKNNCYILDIGCGGGFLDELIQKIEPSAKLVGLEISRLGIKLCREKGVEVQICNVDLKGLPYKSNKFDIVILSEVIEHLRRPIALLKECFRVLSKNGQLIISTPNRNRLSERLPILPKQVCAGHYKEYTAAEICTFLTQTGFKIKRLKFSYWNTTNKLYNLIGFLLTYIPSLATFIVVDARKETL